MKPRSTTIEKRLIGINEISEYLDISKATLYSWTLQKRIPHIKMGRLLKFDLQEINEWLKRKNDKNIVKAKVKSFRLFKEYEKHKT